MSVRDGFRTAHSYHTLCAAVQRHMVRLMDAPAGQYRGFLRGKNNGNQLNILGVWVGGCVLRWTCMSRRHFTMTLPRLACQGGAADSHHC